MSSTLALSNYIILDIIGDFLQISHLSQCVLVSKEWNNCFTPKLWNFIDLRWKIDPANISRHQQNIRSITSFNELGNIDLENVNFPNLRHILDYGTPDILDRERKLGYANIMSSQFSESCLDFLSHATRLESLYLFIPDRSPLDPISRIPNVLRGLSLSKLDITIRLPVTLVLLQSIISNAYLCETLQITIVVNASDITRQIDNLKKSIAQLPETNIRHLSIKTLGTNVDIEIVAPLLEKSPKVVSIYLCQPYTLETLRQISDLLLDDNRPQLKFLGIEETVSHLQDFPIYWETVQSLFQDVANKHIDSIKRPTLCFKHTLTPGSSRPTPGDQHSRFFRQNDIIIDVYSRCFSRTLTSLELENYSMDKLIVLLSCLPLLQSIEVNCSLFRAELSNQLTPDDSISIAKMRRFSWTGVQIKTFRIGISYHSNEFSHALLDCLFMNIGRLELLEELSLYCSNNVFDILSTKHINHLTPHLTHLSQVNLRIRNMRMTELIETDPIKHIKLIIKGLTGLRYLGLQSCIIQTSQRSIIRDIADRQNIVVNFFQDNE